MSTFIAVSITCWLCTIMAVPRKPRFGNEVEELVYARLLGRQRRLVLLAIGITAVLFFAAIIALPQRADALHAAPNAPAAVSCADEMVCPWMYGL